MSNTEKTCWLLRPGHGTSLCGIRTPSGGGNAAAGSLRRAGKWVWRAFAVNITTVCNIHLSSIT